MPIVYYYLLNVREILTYFTLKVTTKMGQYFLDISTFVKYVFKCI